jgi:uncharacterized membrane protein
MILRPRETSMVRRAPKWLLAVLVVSLLLNGLIVGAVASRWHRGPPGPPALGSSSNSQLYGFAVTLPSERWQDVQKAVEGDRAAVRELRQTVHAIRDEARKILVTEPFDAQSYAATQKRLFDAEQTMRLRAIDMVTAVAQQLTPAERAAYARWEEEDRSRRRAFWRGLRERDDKGGPK